MNIWFWCLLIISVFVHTEGELETEWLQAAGLGSLAAPFQAGLEVTEAQLGEAVRPLPREQAAAVRRRVRRLNRTVRRKRAASRARKPDIRDVFRDLEVSSTYNQTLFEHPEC